MKLVDVVCKSKCRVQNARRHAGTVHNGHSSATTSIFHTGRLLHSKTTKKHGSTMSSNDSASETASRSKIFSTQEFMDFLAKQADEITALQVTTKSGDRISASFNSSGTGATSGKDEAFKSLDAMKAFFSEDSTGETASAVTGTGLGGSATAKSKGPGKDFLTSKDWSLDYAKSHVDVTYDKCFTDGSGNASANKNGVPPALEETSLPPKKRTGKTDWNAMYNNALSPLVEAAARAQPQPLQHENETSQSKTSSRTSTKPKVESDKKRKSRKIIPAKMEFVDDYTDRDVLFGRGGRSNHHLGNKLYRELVTERQSFYRDCDKNEKTKVAQAIVDAVQKDQKGRFLERDTATRRYYMVPNLMARRKVGQALRENNTELARAAKREKYGQGKLKNDQCSEGDSVSASVGASVSASVGASVSASGTSVPTSALSSSAPTIVPQPATSAQAI